MPDWIAKRVMASNNSTTKGLANYRYQHLLQRRATNLENGENGAIEQGRQVEIKLLRLQRWKNLVLVYFPTASPGSNALASVKCCPHVLSSGAAHAS